MMSKNFLYKIKHWDQRVILRVNGFGGKYLTLFLRGLSFFGRETIWICLMIYFFFMWYDPLLFSQISSTFMIGVITIAPLKKIVNRSRPFETLEQVQVLEPKPISRSFPSWHAYNAVSQALLFSIILDSIILSMVFICIAALISFSRTQLGAHYPSDVIIGCIIGIFGFILSISLVSPLLHFIIGLFEPLIPFEISYRVISPLLGYYWYVLIVILMFIIVLYVAFYKRIKTLLKKFKFRRF